MAARILVADDDRAIRRLLKLTLGLEDYEVSEAESTDQAWKMLLREPVDLLILDLIMPGMPARELVKKIRADFQFPILVLSGNHAGLEIGMLLGADDVMEKPFDPVELSIRIKRLLSSDEHGEEPEAPL